jgi:hypothetical protein
VTGKGVHPYGLGRWSFITMRGKADRLLTIISAYRVCQKSSSSTGVKTAYMQQYRSISQERNQVASLPQVEPNRQFILDLQTWVQFLQAQGHQIILCLDNNEDLYASKGSIQPLEFDPNNHAQLKSYNGSLQTLAITCGLIDILAIQHSSCPFPPTYIRGNKRLDYILISSTLQDAVERSGILPYNSLFPGNHCPCFIDLNTTILFECPTPPPAPPCQRSLQLLDPRRVNTYREVLHKQLEYHKISNKLQTLTEAALNGSWTPDHTFCYEQLDSLITEAMLLAERNCSKKYTKHFEWSPTLINSVETVRYWRLLLKCTKGLTVQNTTFTWPMCLPNEQHAIRSGRKRNGPNIHCFSISLCGSGNGALKSTQVVSIHLSMHL